LLDETALDEALLAGLLDEAALDEALLAGLLEDAALEAVLLEETLEEDEEAPAETSGPTEHQAEDG
jgi:hypothetical protein